VLSEAQTKLASATEKKANEAEIERQSDGQTAKEIDGFNKDLVPHMKTYSNNCGVTLKPRVGSM